MSKRAKAGLVFVALGILCLTAALGLFQSNRSEALEAEESARSVMEKLAPAIVEQAREESLPPEPVEEAPLPSFDPTMPIVEIDGERYIGFLTIQDLELELPVMEDWDYDKLKIAPCRFSGTLLERNLTIAAHNYQRHFGRLMNLSLGAEVLFTDVKGETTRFTVAELEVLQPNDIERMTAGDYDLTLFTCTYGGATRFAVRCLLAG